MSLFHSRWTKEAAKELQGKIRSFTGSDGEIYRRISNKEVIRMFDQIIETINDIADAVNDFEEGIKKLEATAETAEAPKEKK